MSIGAIKMLDEFIKDKRVKKIVKRNRCDIKHRLGGYVSLRARNVEKKKYL